jgi:hypothetical protein
MPFNDVAAHSLDRGWLNSAITPTTLPWTLVFLVIGEIA